MFPSGDLDRMQAAQQAHMGDTCHRWVYSETPNDYNEVKPVWTENTTDLPCGLEQKGSKTETVEEDMTTIAYDAILRLPISQAEVWDVKDRLTITKRFGSAVTPILYGIVAPVQRGPSGIRLVLQKVDT